MPFGDRLDARESQGDETGDRQPGDVEAQEEDDRARALRLSQSIVRQSLEGPGPNSVNGRVPAPAEWKTATRHSHSSRSKDLRRVNRQLASYHAARSPEEKAMALELLAQLCAIYAGKKSGGKRRQLVTSLGEAARSELGRLQAAQRPAQPGWRPGVVPAQQPVSPAPAPQQAPQAPSASKQVGDELWQRMGPFVAGDVEKAGSAGMPWTEISDKIAGSLKSSGYSGSPDGILRWAWQAGLFFRSPRDPARIVATSAELDFLAVVVIGKVRSASVARAALETRISANIAGHVPFDGKAVIDHALAKGWIVEVNGKLAHPAMPAAPGEQDSIRQAATGKQSAQAGRVADRGGAGWATLGMWQSHTGEDQQGVRYLQGGDREERVLRLVNGQFIDASGALANGPDLQGEAPAEVWASNPAAATARRKQIAIDEHGWTKEEAEQANAGGANRDKALWGQISLRVVDELRNDPRLIFVMNSGGQFFAGRGYQNLTHHSSFLAGGSVAAAGELGLSGGRPTVISNESGHYQPGPAYLWQALRQMQLGGVNVASVRVELYGCAPLTGKELLETFDPSAPVGDPRHLSFDQDAAVAAIRAWQAKRS